MASPTAPTHAPGFARLAAALAVASVGAVLLSQALLLAQGQPPAAQKPPDTQSTSGQSQGQGQAAPGQPGAPQDQRPTFRTGANLVRVDAYPTASGKPVLDLKQEDFEVQEDGVPQQVETFEHVIVRAPTAEEAAALPEPNTVQQARELAAESKARLFVLFIDTYHISRGGALNVRDSLIRFLRRTLGPDDLVAVTTPELSASTVTFARRTGTIEDLVDRFYRWSRRDSITDFDPIEDQYMRCYPAMGGEPGGMSAIAREMIQRRRERLTLEALQGLVVHLGGIREERKAVLAVSEGWVLYQRNNALTQATQPGQTTSGLSGGQVMGMAAEQSRCDADRFALSQEDHQLDFHRMLDDANRANVSFYPVDPRGLVVFDTPISQGVDILTDAAYLRTRLDSLMTLADATDGVAIVNSNDIDKGLRRVVDDLTSYYLLGYYSTNSKLDGRFRSIKVTVKRRGVDVRARRGYRAATKEELASRDKAIEAASAPVSPVAGALSGLSKIRSQAVVQAQAGYSWTPSPDGSMRPTLWLAGEWDPSIMTRDEQWKSGAEVSVTVTAPDKATLQSSTQTLTREARTFLLKVPVPAGQTAGEYSVRLTSKPAGATLGTTETVHVLLPKWPAAGSLAVGQPVAFRRGPFTGLNWLPVGDLRFRRQERLKIEVQVTGPMTTSSVRLLDRAGNALGVPVVAGERDESGGKVVTGEVTLAPLTVGDYVLEFSITQGTTTNKVLAAFRIVP